MTADLKERLKKIKMVILDVDGVLTDGSITYDSKGNEIKTFHVLDGTGIKFARRLGLIVVFLSGRESPIVEQRAKELTVEEVHQKIWGKKKVYLELLKKYDLRDEEVCAIGDDVLDLGVLQSCGLAVAVPNAVSEVKEVAHMVTQRSGGRGAVRERHENNHQTKKPFFKLHSSNSLDCFVTCFPTSVNPHPMIWVFPNITF